MKTLTVPRAVRSDLRAYAPLAHYAALSAVILIGAYLRLTALSRQSLWFDEIDVVVRAQRPFGQVLHTFVQQGENGPLYNLMLALWIRLAGISEIAVRFPSAVAGTLAIPLIYLLGRRVAGSTVGLLAAALLAISPYHVWYSQEAKMYSIVVLLALASTYAFVAALETNERLWWVAYVVVTSLMFYTHVVTVLVFVAQSLYAVLSYRSWPGREKSWLISAAALTLPYVPIAIWAAKVVGLTNTHVATWQPPVALWDAIQIFGIKFAINRYNMTQQVRAEILYAVLAGIGIFTLAWLSRRTGWWLLFTLLTVVPVFGLWLVSIRQSVFSDRYGIVALPAYLLLIAVAVGWMLRQRVIWPLGLLAAFFLIGLAWGPLRDVNRTDTAQKEDWRSAYAHIGQQAQPGDIILVQPGYLISTYDYYKQRDPALSQYQALAIGSFTVPWYTEQLMLHNLHEQAGDATRFWLVQSPDRVPGDDPNKILADWLAGHGKQLNEEVVNGVIVRLFQLNAPVPG
jgi:4-amino-4-deoxy-L-arabinose transferase-like glycosyltransferase